MWHRRRHIARVHTGYQHIVYCIQIFLKENKYLAIFCVLEAFVFVHCSACEKNEICLLTAIIRLKKCALLYE